MLPTFSFLRSNFSFPYYGFCFRKYVPSTIHTYKLICRGLFLLTLYTTIELLLPGRKKQKNCPMRTRNVIIYFGSCYCHVQSCSFHIISLYTSINLVEFLQACPLPIFPNKKSVWTEFVGRSSIFRPCSRTLCPNTTHAGGDFLLRARVPSLEDDLNQTIPASSSFNVPRSSLGCHRRAIPSHVDLSQTI